MRVRIGSVVLICLAAGLPASVVSAHIQLASPLKKRYNLRTVACKACHLPEQKKKTRDALTDFGADIAKIVEGKMISERIAATKKLSPEARKQTLDELKKEYLAALDKLDGMESPSGKLYSEAIPAGEIEGTKPR